MSKKQSIEKLRAVLVGAGYVSAYHARALRSLDLVDLVGVCDSDFTKAEALAKRFRIKAARCLDDLAPLRPNVVHVLTPPASHCKITLDALRMGCHVFVEKPMAQTEDECARMIAAAKDAGCILSVNHSARMDPVVLRALQDVRKGVCGDLVSIEIRRSSDYPPYPGGALPPHYTSGGYPFQDIGVHGLYLIEAFMGPIRRVDSKSAATGRNPLLTFDEWYALVDCERGLGHLHLSWNIRPIQNEVVISGTEGVMHLDCYLQTCTLRRRISAPKPVQHVYNAIANSVKTIGTVTANTFRMVTGGLLPSPGIHNGVCGFYRALHSGTTVPVPAEEGRRMVAWTESATQSAEKAKTEIVRRLSTPPDPAQILITGASGFLGGSLVARLVQEGQSPRVLLRSPSPSLERISGVSVVYGDLGNPEDVDRAVAGVEVVYHAGAAMRGCKADFECATLWGTRNVIDACLKHKVRKLVHVSSVGVLDHGRRDEILNEAAPLEPNPSARGHYTQFKLLAEQLVSTAIRERGLPAVILRPGMIFGPGAKRTAPAGAFAVGRSWVVMGRGKFPLPLVYVDDVVDAMLLAATEKEAVGKIFHLVDPCSVTQREYIDLCRQDANGLKRALYVPKAALYQAAIAMEILARLLRRTAPLTRYKLRSLRPLSAFDVSSAQSILHWVPSVGVGEGLRRTFTGSTVRSIGSIEPQRSTLGSRDSENRTQAATRPEPAEMV